MPNAIQSFLSHLIDGDRGKYTTKTGQAVSGDELDRPTKELVDSLAYLRDNSTEPTPEIQAMINHLYNPNTRQRAYDLYSKAPVEFTPGQISRYVHDTITAK